ncbi:hypothetical protein [Allorhizocola rhizosphaerae]|uniref:hypothetical protein n=1 Tax=Allorhizocola rhizosphaerae TaxID=1872709 RepID=UPI0013C35FB0|nr:hypothetical protein [Allorhizocola rhizosphaerae]
MRSNTAVLSDLTRRIVRERDDSGDDRVRHWHYTGLDYMGCHWHPSVRDHQVIAEQLDELIASLPLRW